MFERGWRWRERLEAATEVQRGGRGWGWRVEESLTWAGRSSCACSSPAPLVPLASPGPGLSGASEATDESTGVEVLMRGPHVTVAQPRHALTAHPSRAPSKLSWTTRA